MEKIDLRNKEYWKPVRGYEGKYEVSNLGRVRSLNYNHTGKTRELRAANDRYGYLQVKLFKDGKGKCHLVHRLVWEAFCCIIPEWAKYKLCINHLDEDKTNNNLLNLELCTYKKNINYGTRTERAARAMIGNTYAKANINNPLRSKGVNQIDKLTGEVLNTYPSTAEAHRQTGIHQGNIVKCCLSQRNSTGGFKWKYVNN